MNERDLIRKVSKKDNDACKEIIEKYHNMIYKIIYSFTLNWGDYNVSEEELYQEGCIGLYEACRNYSKMQDCKFSTYVYAVVRRKIKRYITRQIDIYRHESVSYDKYNIPDGTVVFENKYVYDNPIEYSNKEYTKTELKKTLSNLNSIDQTIIKLRLENYSYDQISKMLKIPKKKVDNRLQFLKRKQFFKN